MKVVRNLPNAFDLDQIKNSDQERLPGKDNYKAILYQGSVNIHRGLEELIQAMEHLEKFKLYIAGEGDILAQLKFTVSNLSWKERIVFLGRIPFEDLPYYTSQADLGISIEKKIGKSYTYALPNKFFDYIQSGIPVLISDLPELKRMNEEYNVAEEIKDHSSEGISQTILELFADINKYNILRDNCLKARKVLNWELESEKLKPIFQH